MKSFSLIGGECIGIIIYKAVGNMKTIIKGYDNSNIVGKNIETLCKDKGIKQKDFIPKLQTAGIDINPTSFSKLEGNLEWLLTKKYML